MDVIQLLLTMVQVVGAIVMWGSILLFFVKTIWNLGVPYAMVREALTRPKDRHGWSLFILLDIGLVGLGLLGSVIAGPYSVTSTWTMALYGIGAIAFSYVHLISLLLLGVLFGFFPKNSHTNVSAK